MCLFAWMKDLPQKQVYVVGCFIATFWQAGQRQPLAESEKQLNFKIHTIRQKSVCFAFDWKPPFPLDWCYSDQIRNRIQCTVESAGITDRAKMRLCTTQQTGFVCSLLCCENKWCSQCTVKYTEQLTENDCKLEVEGPYHLLVRPGTGPISWYSWGGTRGSSSGSSTPGPWAG